MQGSSTEGELKVDSVVRSDLPLILNVALLWAALLLLNSHPPAADLQGGIIVAGYLTMVVCLASFIAGMLLTEWNKDSAMGLVMISFFLFFLSFTLYAHVVNQPLGEPVTIVLGLTLFPFLLGLIFTYPAFWAGQAGHAFIHLFTSSSNIDQELETIDEDFPPNPYNIGQETSDIPNPYALLGLSQDADPDEVKQRYRELAKIYHPDSSRNPRSADLFILIQEAYQTINNRREGEA